MKTEDFLRLNKKQLIDKCISSNANYLRAQGRYRNLKADILIIKKQTHRISEGIQFRCDKFGDKANSFIGYFPSGKNSYKSPKDKVK